MTGVGELPTYALVIEHEEGPTMTRVDGDLEMTSSRKTQ